MNGLPHIEQTALAIDTTIDEYVDEVVRPYCQRLMNRVQERCKRHTLSFIDGMGATFVCVDDEPRDDLTDACATGPGSRYADRFPELVEIMDITFRLAEYPFNRDLGCINPTVAT
jgi:hypothetical protein